MFGAPWTQQTLGAVLRHFKGHMENTIEAILAHGDGSPMALVNRLRGGDDMSNSMSMQESDEAFARRLAASSSTASSSSSSSSSAAGAGALPASSSKNNGTPKKGRGNPTTLPPDFLRIPGRSYPDSGSTNSGIRQDVVNQNQPNSPPQTQQMLADEQLARMLQDEMFMRELSRNPEFAFLAQGGGVGGGGGGAGAGAGDFSVLVGPDRSATYNSFSNSSNYSSATTPETSPTCRVPPWARRLPAWATKPSADLATL